MIYIKENIDYEAGRDSHPGIWRRSDSLDDSDLQTGAPCLLLVSMLWHRQAIFESKGNMLSSSAECRIRTQGLRHQIASRLNASWQTGWAIEDQAKNFNSTARPYDQRAFSPLDLITTFGVISLHMLSSKLLGFWECRTLWPSKVTTWMLSNVLLLMRYKSILYCFFYAKCKDFVNIYNISPYHRNMTSTPSPWRSEICLMIKTHNFVMTKVLTDYLHWKDTVIVLYWFLSAPSFSSLTFSPISVLSPPGRILRSGSIAHASSISWYLVSSQGWLNRMLFLSVLFWIQACWGTYAKPPYEKTQK